uniref:Uncharacterized protein n=1 Tax=Romanomermis culicivorax TaxID=13658 RepID=A0A915JB40_ROMCU
MPPSRHSNNHCSHHKSHHHEDRHRKAMDHSTHQDPETRDSHQQDHHTDAPWHHTQSPQTQQVHSTGFYERDNQHVFHPSPPKMTDNALQGQNPAGP